MALPLPCLRSEDVVRGFLRLSRGPDNEATTLFSRFSQLSMQAAEFSSVQGGITLHQAAGTPLLYGPFRSNGLLYSIETLSWLRERGDNFKSDEAHIARGSLPPLLQIAVLPEPVCHRLREDLLLGKRPHFLDLPVRRGF